MIAAPLMLPAAVGAKSMAIEQVAPAASVNADAEPASVCAHVDAASSQVKLVLTLGFVPAAGSGKVSTNFTWDDGLRIICAVECSGRGGRGEAQAGGRGAVELEQLTQHAPVDAADIVHCQGLGITA